MSGRIVVAMSGGVDSSVAAAMAVEAGHEVVGITLQLYDHGAAVRSKGCCAGVDIHDARSVADQLGIPHYVLDFEERFRRAVIDDFADSYSAGRTPIPCVRCNERVKFRDLLDIARDLGASCLVTGHYARIVHGPDGPELHRGLEAARDQSYFLYRTTRGQLDFLRFPLGGLTKQEVRQHARRLGLGVADKTDSQDICFVPDGGYARTLERLRPGVALPGEIVDLAGNVLGRHDGVSRFTVGQRRGLELGGLAEPLYVIRIEAGARRVVVGPRSALGTEGAELSEFSWIGPPVPAAGLEVEVKVRSTSPAVPARIFAGERPRVSFLEPEPAVAPGQACVAYSGSRLLGGGWIERTFRAGAAAESRLEPIG
jgi:tRNA-specific 2-thiouridylase